MTPEPIEADIAALRRALLRGFMTGDEIADSISRLLDYVEGMRD